MSTIREHLREFHDEAASHHGAKATYHDGRADSHTQHAARHKEMHKASGMSENQEGPHLSFALLHAQDAALHKSAAATHRAHADYHRSAMAACTKGMDAADLDKLVPTNVSAVAPTRPTITPVPRFGQRPIGEASAVEPDIRKMLALDAEEQHTEEMSLQK